MKEKLQRETAFFAIPMLLRYLRHRPQLFCCSFSTLPTSLKWRNDLKNQNIVSQVSSLLLQHKDWDIFLRSHPCLLPKPAPRALILRILAKIKSDPGVSLHFFTWAQSNLSFQPDLMSLSMMTRILVVSNLFDQARPLLESALKSYQTQDVLDSMSGVIGSKDSCSEVLGFVLRTYCSLRFTSSALEAFVKMTSLGSKVSGHSCNALLHALCVGNEVKAAWCCYAVMVRKEWWCWPDSRMWSLLARLYCMGGKLEKALMLLDLGYCGASTYDLIIELYCRRGQLQASISLLKRMHKEKIAPTFNTYSLVLDAGCKLKDQEVIESILSDMAAEHLLPVTPCFDYEYAIKRLCVFDRSFAAEMFFERARDEGIKVGDGAYICLLKAMLKAKCVHQAMKLYKLMCQMGIQVNPKSFDVFLSGICNEEPLEEVGQVLEDAMRRGFVPNSSDLSKHVAALCAQGRLKKASNLVDVALDSGILLDTFCLQGLVFHYCTNGQSDLALALHNKIRILGGCFKLSSYYTLLKTLFQEKRIEEAIQVFDCMRENNILDSRVYLVVIHELCYEKEMRKAMNLHDEMLNLGHKPDERSYRLLISHFNNTQ